MGWPRRTSFYESRVEWALQALTDSFPICYGFRHNRSTWFSGRLRYDFVLDGLPSSAIQPPLIEVHGEQHYRGDRFNGNDLVKARLAGEWGCPLLVVPYKNTYSRDVLHDCIRDWLLALGYKTF